MLLFLYISLLISRRIYIYMYLYNILNLGTVILLYLKYHFNIVVDDIKYKVCSVNA